MTKKIKTPYVDLEKYENEENGIIVLKPNTLISPSADLLNINEQRILFYAIFKIQTSKQSVSFTRAELNEMYNMDFGSFSHIKKYLINLRTFGMDVIDDESNKVRLINAFSVLEYDNGLFTFEFNQGFLPAINNQKRFLQYGMIPISKFTSKYSVYLYNYLKDQMWGNISVKKRIPVAEFKKIFKLDDKKYEGRNNSFKARVWQTALDEINEFSDYKIAIEQEGIGSRTLYNIYRVVNEDLSIKHEIPKTTEFKCTLGKCLVDEGCHKCMKINLCPYSISIDSFEKVAKEWEISIRTGYFMENIFFVNKYYSIFERQKNNKLSYLEIDYLKQITSTAEHFAGEGSVNIAQEIRDAREFNEQAVLYRLLQSNEISYDEYQKQMKKFKKEESTKGESPF